MKKSCCRIRHERNILWYDKMTLPDGKEVWVDLYQEPDLNHPHGDPAFLVIADREDCTNTPFGQDVINRWIDANPEMYALLPKTHIDWLEWEYKMLMDNINAGEPEPYWLIEGKDVVCRNRTDENREWYRLHLKDVDTEEKLHRWVDHLTHKNWLTSQHILQFVDMCKQLQSQTQ
jgi:hypothetical protein